MKDDLPRVKQFTNLPACLDHQSVFAQVNYENLAN